MTLIETPPAGTEDLSRQEWAIQNGAKSVHGGITDRVQRLYDAIRASYRPRVTLERAIYFTESFQTTEGQPLILRWAKALKHIAENISVTIFDDELIVGRPNTWRGRYTLVYPELDGSLLQAGADAFAAAEQSGSTEAVIVTPDDRKIIDERLFPYWDGKDFTPNSATWRRGPGARRSCHEMTSAGMDKSLRRLGYWAMNS